MDPEKVKAVQEWPTSTSRKKFQRFLGFANFYRNLIRNFSHIASPLHALTSSKVQFLWSPQAESAFKRLKSSFIAVGGRARDSRSLVFTSIIGCSIQEGQSSMYFLQRLKSFHMCSKVLATSYQSMVGSTLWCAGVVEQMESGYMVNRLAKKASRVMGLKLDSLEVVGERRKRDEVKPIHKNPSHPLHEELWLRESTFSQRLTLPRCRMERFRCRTVQQCNNLMLTKFRYLYAFVCRVSMCQYTVCG